MSSRIEIVEQPTQVVVQNETNLVETVEQVTIVELGSSGPQGATGTPGATGPQGPAGPTLAYVHTQNSVSALWTIVHGLGIYPQVTVNDSAGTMVEGDVHYIDNNSLTIQFGAAFSGTAYLS